MTPGQVRSDLLSEYLRETGSPPKFSSDWLFLPGMPSGGKALVFAGIQDGYALPFSERFDETIFIEEHPFVEKSLPNHGSMPGNVRKESIEFLSDPALLNACDLIAMPLGLSNTSPMKEGEAKLPDFDAIRHLLKPGGVYYFSFSNRWDIRRLFGRADASGERSSPLRLSRYLRRSGFTSAVFYGAIPNYHIPSLFFSLTPNAIGFALQRRYRRKLPAILMSLINNPVAASALKPLLPSYCVVARR